MVDGGPIDDDFGLEWQRLQGQLLELREALGADLDPDERALLVDQVKASRAAIVRLEQTRDRAGGSDQIDVSVADSQLGGAWFSDESDVSGSVEADQTVDEIAVDTDVEVLLNSLGVDPPKVKRTVGTGAGDSVSLRSALVGAVGMSLLIGMGALIWLVASDRAGDNAASERGTNLAAEGEPLDLANEVDQLSGVLDLIGLDGVNAELRGSVIFLTGTVESHEDFRDALGATEILSDEVDVDFSELIVAPSEGTTVLDESVPETGAGSDQRGSALQVEVDRITAATPIIFEPGVSELTELQSRLLNNLVSAILGYPDFPILIVGYTDAEGDPEVNSRLSLMRASSVRDYLVSRGVPEARLTVEARGEETASGSAALAGLERRVELEVGASDSARVIPNAAILRIALVAPSASNDLAFTQSMVDAIDVIAEERGNVEVSITDNTFVPAEAAAAISGYADQDYDLVIAHGVEFGSALLDIVRDHPDVTFAWGTATDTFGLPNLYAYDAAAEEGGYVMGAMSALLSSSKVVGVIGPIEVGDAQRYVNGFEAGALGEAPSSSVLVAYTGSFSDVALAAEFAEAHLAAGADVLTGSGEMVVGAVAVADDNDVLWFGTQARQDVLASNVVVASQVYHWEVVLRPIVTDIDAGTPRGQAHVAQLSNDGLVIEYNPGFELPETVRRRADQLTADIISDAIAIPTNR